MKKKYSKREWVDWVTKNNAEFEAASPGEKRVIIAKDVLSHIEAGIINEHQSCGYYYEEFGSGNEPANIRDALVESENACAACARGCLVYAAVLRRNSVMGPCFDGEEFIEEFPRQMLLEIEAAFEYSGAFLAELSASLDAGDELILETRRRHNEWRLDTDRAYRLRAVMQWIIDHEGEFSVVDFLREKALEITEESS